MIYAPRSSDTNHTCTKINFRGFEISIAMDDRCLSGSRCLTRSSLAVYRGVENVTHQVAGRHNLVDGEILFCDGETLFEIMQAIVKQDPVGPIQLPEGDGAI